MKKVCSAELNPSASGGLGAGAGPGDTPTRSAPAPTRQKPEKTAWSLWLWVVAGFLFLAVLWTALFMASRQIDARTVPLAPKEAKP